jgi:hypothetical protein
MAKFGNSFRCASPPDSSAGDLDSESTDIAWTDPQDIPALKMHPSMRLRIQARSRCRGA